MVSHGRPRGTTDGPGRWRRACGAASRRSVWREGGRGPTLGLDPSDAEKRGLDNRTPAGKLGYAVQYVFAREHGRFPSDDDDVAPLVQNLRAQGLTPMADAHIERLLRSAARAYSSELQQRLSGSLSEGSRAAIGALVKTDSDASHGASEFATLRQDSGAVGVRSILAEVERLRKLRELADGARSTGTQPLGPRSREPLWALRS